MAELILTALLPVIFEKLTSVAVNKITRSKEIHSELKKWERSLSHIRSFLEDASQKEVTQAAVRQWLNGLQHLAYDIDDILDALATDAMCHEFTKESEGISSKVRKLIPACCTNFSLSTRMDGKLNSITTRLQELIDEKNNLGLIVKDGGQKNKNRNYQTSLVDAPSIVGREGDKKELLQKLLGDEPSSQNFSIVPIVGMGGIGKTTLARLLYDDQQVKDHFELKAWVCVSDDFDCFNISKVIFQSTGGENKNFADLNLLQADLKIQLTGKRLHGEGIVKKCDGLPLALKALGSLLRTKTDEEDWKQLWGFLHNSATNKSMERLGEECFQELLSRSFFQHVPDDELSFVMHDLMNDLATFVAGEFYSRLDIDVEKNVRNEAYKKYRHMSFAFQTYMTYNKFKAFERANSLRTFLAMPNVVGNSWQRFFLSSKILVDTLPQLPLLRVLSLSRLYIDELPECVGNMKHLRYLNLSRTRITHLPEFVCNLYNLQTLIVSGCHSLTTLPDNFLKLKNLQHFDIRDTSLWNMMPLGISEMISLQTLSNKIVVENNDFFISWLKNLKNLQRNISIQGLDKVQSARDIREVNLKLMHVNSYWKRSFSTQACPTPHLPPTSRMGFESSVNFNNQIYMPSSVPLSIISEKAYTFVSVNMNLPAESKRNEVFFERYDKRGRMRRKSIKLQPANTRIRGFEYLSENKLGRCSKWGWTEDVLGVVKIVEPHSGRLYLRTHYEHKTLALMSVGLNAMVPVAVGGGVGGDNFWVVGPRNEFRSGYSGSGRGSGVWNNNHVSQTLKTHTSSAAPKGTSSNVRGTSSSCGKRKPQPQLDSYGFQMQRESDARNISVNSTLPASRDVKFGDETKQIHAMNEMNGRLCSTRRMRIRPATTKMLLIDNGSRQPAASISARSTHGLPNIDTRSRSRRVPAVIYVVLSRATTLRNRCFCYSYDDGCSDTLALYNMGCLDIAASCNGTSSPLKSQQGLCESASLSKEIKKFAECLQQCVVARKYSAVRKALLFQEGRKQATLTVVTRRWEWCLMDMDYSILAMRTARSIVSALGKRPPSTTSFPHAYAEGGGAPPATNQTISIDRNIRRRLTTTPSHNTVDATALLAPSKLHVHTNMMQDAVT
ncbi:NB-ARC domains-containing protein [Tanacetum coccineum]|uniref:NB-ARC domains-containing protein n=1 Tax=Tanacetum coccineum TaxID=301880 RepID=A0ABQ5ES93_9ASTR